MIFLNQELKSFAFEYTEEREDGDRDGVSGVRVLEALEDAEKRGGLGARENPLGYAGAELEQSE